MYELTADQIGSNPGTCIVLGAPDLGKSTFCAFLASYCARLGLRVAVIDADLGQSNIGPPGTVGMGFVDNIVSSLTEIELTDAYFVGAKSPDSVEHLCLVGLQLMHKQAKKCGADMVIVDTTGAVLGRTGRRLKEAKMQMLRPDHIVALQNQNELEHLLRPIEKISDQMIYRLPKLPKTRDRGYEERKFLRSDNYARHLANHTIKTIEMNDVDFSRTHLFYEKKCSNKYMQYLESIVGDDVLYAETVPEGLNIITRNTACRELAIKIKSIEDLPRVNLHSLHHMKNMYVGYRDKDANYLGIGVLQNINFKEQSMDLLVNPEVSSVVAEIVFSCLRVNYRGRELGFTDATISTGF